MPEAFNGSELRPLGSLCDLLNGLPFRPDEWTEQGLPIIRIQNLNGGTDFNFYDKPVSEEYRIPSGTLLFSWSGNRGTSFGPFLWRGPTGILNQHIFKVTPRAGVFPGWLYHSLSIARDRAERAAHGGSGLVHVRRNDLRGYLIPTPSFAEQRRIAEILDAADEAIAGTESVIAKLRLEHQGLAQRLLALGGRRTTLGAALGECGGFLQTGPFGSQLHAEEYETEGIPVVMPQDIKGGTIDEASIARVSTRRALALGRHAMRPNDVVFARRGDLSRSAAIGQRESGWLCGTGCLLLRAPASSLLGAWVAAVYAQEGIQRQVAAMAVGSTMVNLNTGILAALRVHLPTVDEQRRVVEVLNAACSHIHAEEAYHDKLKLQKQGLMQNLLTGKVRVMAQ